MNLYDYPSTISRYHQPHSVAISSPVLISSTSGLGQCNRPTNPSVKIATDTYKNRGVDNPGKVPIDFVGAEEDGSDYYDIIPTVGQLVCESIPISKDPSIPNKFRDVDQTLRKHDYDNFGKRSVVGRKESKGIVVCRDSDISSGIFSLISEAVHIPASRDASRNAEDRFKRFDIDGGNGSGTSMIKPQSDDVQTVRDQLALVVTKCQEYSVRNSAPSKLFISKRERSCVSCPKIIDSPSSPTKMSCLAIDIGASLKYSDRLEQSFTDCKPNNPSNKIMNGDVYDVPAPVDCPKNNSRCNFLASRSMTPAHPLPPEVPLKFVSASGDPNLHDTSAQSIVLRKSHSLGTLKRFSNGNHVINEQSCDAVTNCTGGTITKKFDGAERIGRFMISNLDESDSGYYVENCSQAPFTENLRDVRLSRSDSKFVAKTYTNDVKYASLKNHQSVNLNQTDKGALDFINFRAMDSKLSDIFDMTLDELLNTEPVALVNPNLCPLLNSDTLPEKCYAAFKSTIEPVSTWFDHLLRLDSATNNDKSVISKSWKELKGILGILEQSYKLNRALVRHYAAKNNSDTKWDDTPEPNGSNLPNFRRNFERPIRPHMPSSLVGALKRADEGRKSLRLKIISVTPKLFVNTASASAHRNDAPLLNTSTITNSNRLSLYHPKDMVNKTLLLNDSKHVFPNLSQAKSSQKSCHSSTPDTGNKQFLGTLLKSIRHIKSLLSTLATLELFSQTSQPEIPPVESPITCTKQTSTCLDCSDLSQFYEYGSPNTLTSSSPRSLIYNRPLPSVPCANPGNKSSNMDGLANESVSLRSHLMSSDCSVTTCQNNRKSCPGVLEEVMHNYCPRNTCRTDKPDISSSMKPNRLIESSTQKSLPIPQNVDATHNCMRLYELQVDQLTNLSELFRESLVSYLQTCLQTDQVTPEKIANGSPGELAQKLPSFCTSVLSSVRFCTESQLLILGDVRTNLKTPFRSSGNSSSVNDDRLTLPLNNSSQRDCGVVEDHQLLVNQMSEKFKQIAQTTLNNLNMLLTSPIDSLNNDNNFNSFDCTVKSLKKFWETLNALVHASEITCKALSMLLGHK